MYGWRARIGLIVPSSNTTMEEEFRSALPDGVSLHVARVRLRKVNVEELKKMEEFVELAADMLADAGVDVIAYGCTTGSLVGGVGYDERIANKIERMTGVKAVATATAVLEALRHLDVKSVAVATPYIDEVNKKEEEFLEGNGFKVVSMIGLGIEDNIEIGRQAPEVAYRLGKAAFHHDADGLFISCTNFRTFEVLEALEVDLGKPVISSNSATLWAVLKEVGIKEPVVGLGELLEFGLG